MSLNLSNTAFRPKFNTEELAACGKVKAQSIRASLCRKGHWMGLRPVKAPNGRLLWDAADAARVLNGGGK